MARRCPVCGSRKWRKERDSGLVVCEEGHILTSVRDEQLLFEPTGHAMQKRRMTTGVRINKRREYGQANKDFLHGDAAEYLRLQGLQLLLRHQVAALKAIWATPDALELVVRDLWTYQLLMTPVPTPEEVEATTSRSTTPVRSTLEATQQSGLGSPRGSRPGSPLRSRPMSRSGTASRSRHNSRSRSGSRSGSGSGSDTESSEHPSDESRREADTEGVGGELSEATDEEEDSDGDGNSTPSGPIPKRRLRVSDTLVTLILGLLVLRIPFTYATIESLVNTNQIPYIDFAKSTLVPPDMAKRMNVFVQESLNPQLCPTPGFLFLLSRKFARTLTKRFGQVIPEANVPPVAWHVVSRLGGTAITYGQVLALLELVDANMSLNDDGTQDKRQRRPGRATVGRRNSSSEAAAVRSSATTPDSRPPAAARGRYRDVRMPELSIAAAWTVTMKLAYGLDGTPRVPLLTTDPLIGLPPGDAWLDELQTRLDDGTLRGTQSELARGSFATMAPSAVDAFLDRCEDVLLKNRHHGNDAGPFPLPERRHGDAAATVQAAPAPWSFHSLPPVERAAPAPASTRNTDLPLMPGEAYKSYSAADVTGTLPLDFALVLDAAAAVVGVSAVAVGEAVEALERRMEAARPRPEYGAGGGGGSGRRGGGVGMGRSGSGSGGGGAGGHPQMRADAALRRLRAAGLDGAGLRVSRSEGQLGRLAQEQS